MRQAASNPWIGRRTSCRIFDFGGIASVGAVVTVALTFFFLLIAIAKRYKKVGPNEVMIISGRKHSLRNTDGSVEETGFRIRKGGGAFIWPLFERVDLLSLEVMTLEFTTPRSTRSPACRSWSTAWRR